MTSPALSLRHRVVLIQLYNQGIVSFIKIYRVAPLNTVREITEGVALFNIDEANCVLSELHALGLGNAIDGFGAGYSSLKYVRQLPVTELKIDQSLTINVIECLNVQAIVFFIIELAKRLNLRTVAEGIEREQEWKILQELNCDPFQGFYFNHPLSSIRLADWLKEQNHVKLRQVN